MTIEEKFREVLDWSGIQQKELARRTGISKSTISGYLCGQRKMTVEAASKIADALGISVWVLLNGEPLTVTSMDLTEEEQQIVGGYRMLIDSERELIKKTIEVLNDRRKY